MRRRFKAVSLLLALGIVLGAPPVFGQAADDAARNLAVSVEGGLVSVDIGRVPIADVLRAIAGQAGVELIVRGDPGTAMAQSFSGLTLEKSIGRLLQNRKGVGMTIVYEPAAAGQSRGIPIRVVVFATSRPADARASLTASGGETIASTPATLADRATLRAEIRLLARQGDAAAAIRLAQILAESDDTAVRRQAAEALGRFANSEAARGALIDALWDPDWKARMASFNALARVGGDGIAPAFRRVLANADDPRSRRMAALLLARYPGQETRNALEVARLDPETSVSDAAEHAIGLWRQQFGQ